MVSKTATQQERGGFGGFHRKESNGSCRNF